MKLLWWVATGSSTEACTDATAARCATAWQPLTASRRRAASATSPSNSSTAAGRFSRLPVDRLSSTRTLKPCASKASARCEPMKPAPPVMRIGFAEAGVMSAMTIVAVQ
ncbi:hypothetical protein D3C78_1556370 [compost metagenome]